MVAHFLRFLYEVIGIDRDASRPPTSLGAVQVKVSFRAGSLEDFIRADAESCKDHGELVHQGNVEVPLDIFNDLGSLGSFDIRGLVDVGDQPI